MSVRTPFDEVVERQSKAPVHRLAIRGWRNGEFRFEEHYRGTPAELRAMVPAMVAHHLARLEPLDLPYLLEFEFLDEPDPLQRFLRIGTAPRVMLFRCPQCGGTSWNANDLRERYCGHCHAEIARIGK